MGICLDTGKRIIGIYVFNLTIVMIAITWFINIRTVDNIINLYNTDFYVIESTFSSKHTIILLIGTKQYFGLVLIFVLFVINIKFVKVFILYPLTLDLRYTLIVHSLQCAELKKCIVVL